jgi:acetyl esterase
MTNVASLQGEDLEPEIRRFVQTTSEAYLRFGGKGPLTPEESRRVAERVREPWRQGGPQMAWTTEHLVASRHGPVRVRIYAPIAEPDGSTFVYLHGGGWTIFSLDTHDRLMREYAARAGVMVLGIDYALSPEAKFPIAHEQCVDVMLWLADHGREVGIDPHRLGMGGDSAGGNLAIGAALALRDQGRADLIKALVLNYASFGGDFTVEYHARYGGPGYMLSSDEVGRFLSNYLDRPEDRWDHRLRIIDADLVGLPPTFMAIPECDLLSCQSLEMAPRLRAAGVPLTAEIYRGATHSFLEAMSISQIANRALDDEAAWLRERLSA